ncbi:hypothetical protein SODALDRAFT_356016 [Sodiomyces alkalinus F11]|uniref:Uncharacterized protein n=1 Tax=Sodiomyces alkalinus (strain CBS 110278 / VKM F-3762 / F11) TaxID=1314773 RepID=A0A3N2QAL2_SODAK|nr:hypothetical protein SODALDRAFT_356016 [Sodiomyces alkalinus F11]ROT43790.1 hypothetical protein SODALDRAFT_356016 [Sodiomyces alkalinus F11]
MPTTGLLQTSIWATMIRSPFVGLLEISKCRFWDVRLDFVVGCRGSWGHRRSRSPTYTNHTDKPRPRMPRICTTPKKPVISRFSFFIVLMTWLCEETYLQQAVQRIAHMQFYQPSTRRDQTFPTTQYVCRFRLPHQQRLRECRKAYMLPHNRREIERMRNQHEWECGFLSINIQALDIEYDVYCQMDKETMLDRFESDMEKYRTAVRHFIIWAQRPE